MQGKVWETITRDQDDSDSRRKRLFEIKCPYCCCSWNNFPVIVLLLAGAFSTSTKYIPETTLCKMGICE